MPQSVLNPTLRREFMAAFQRVWETAVGLPLEETLASEIDHPRTEWLAGVVWIGGNWTGNVTLMLPSDLAQQVSARMLDVESAVGDSQVRDTVRELTNMSAGNLKSVLPGPCGLAIPGCFEVGAPHIDAEPHFPTVISLAFRCQSSYVIATLKGLEEGIE